MMQWMAFTKKEWMEQLRTGRGLLLVLLFGIFGIMNPAIAKLTPWMMDVLSEQLALSGMSVEQVSVDALTSWAQFFKNMPMALLVFLVMFSGILTAEYQKGTLILILTKGLVRWKVLASKTFVLVFWWTLGYWLSYGLTYGYNAYFWDNGIARHVFLAGFCFYLLGVWLIGVLLLASAILKSASSALLSVGAAFLAAYLLGLFPRLQEYSPAYLMEAGGLLTGAARPEDFVTTLAVLLLLTAVSAAVSVAVFNRRQL